MRIGSLFSGYEGLGMACESAFSATTAWVSDIDPGACKILAHRYPDVPNIGDITKADWSQLEPVDILTGGFPCQDLSHAGKRAGLRPGLADHGLAAADAQGNGRDERRAEPARLVGGSDAAERGARVDLAANPSGERHGRGEDGRSLGLVDGETAGEAREWERAREVAGNRGAAVAADADSAGRSSIGRVERVERDADRRSSADVAWGDYEPAIRRWESVLERVAPAPTETSPKGSQRLSPRFVEWMQGLPEGHVTDVPDLGRNAQLKALGNGVVPQQAFAAITRMLSATEAAA